MNNTSEKLSFLEEDKSVRFKITLFFVSARWHFSTFSILV